MLSHSHAFALSLFSLTLSSVRSFIKHLLYSRIHWWNPFSPWSTTLLAQTLPMWPHPSCSSLLVPGRSHLLAALLALLSSKLLLLQFSVLRIIRNCPYFFMTYYFKVCHSLSTFYIFLLIFYETISILCPSRLYTRLLCFILVIFHPLKNRWNIFWFEKNTFWLLFCFFGW